MHNNCNINISMISFIKLIITKTETILKSLTVAASTVHPLILTFQRTAEQSLYDTRKRKITFELLQEYSYVNLNYQKIA